MHLGRENLQKRIPNLENNNYAHILTFLQAVAVAIVVEGVGMICGGRMYGLCMWLW